MTFSLRSIFVLTFLIALAAFAVSTVFRTHRQQARLDQLRSETETMQVALQIDDPAQYQAKLHQLDQYASLHAMRETAEIQFMRLHEKYRQIETRDATTLSIRSVPSLPAETHPAPTLFRLIVPSGRPVWLKFGVHAESISNTSTIADEASFLSESAFTRAGPYQMRIPTGDHLLSILRGPDGEDSAPLRIAIDDQVLLQTAIVSEDLSGSGGSHISASTQIDYPAGKALPWLQSGKAHLGNKNNSAEFSVWLSDQASDFQEFPRNVP